MTILTVDFKNKMEISSCHDCPFAKYDNDYGYEACLHPSSKIRLSDYEKLPPDIHKDCPLRETAILIKLKTK